nr:carbohydrate-binding domain-containing protein [uncultured Rhodopila sp.]
MLYICESAYQGDAKFTVNVNGVQVGGIETATLNGGTQPFTFDGNWGSAQNTVTVNFVNGLSNADGSRDLFIRGMSYDGTDYANNVQNLYGGGAGSFLIGTAAPVGSGPDTLVLNVCEQAYQGDAQFTVDVNGVQVGGIETATLNGGTQPFIFEGNWGSGLNSVTVDFVNGYSDAGGSRNLFVRGMNYDGTDYANNVQNLYGGGIASFIVGTAAPIGAGSDTLVLHIFETAYQGDAQFTVDVDGVQIGGVETALLLASGGKTQDFTFLGDWGSGQQTVTVNFVNGRSDAGGSRNLFMEGMSYDGTDYSDNTQNLYGGGVGSFLVGTASPIGSGSDTLVLDLSEAAYQGDAEFTVDVDGVRVGVIETVTLLQSSGKSEAFTFLGNWGGGQHSVGINFINGLSDANGSRNLYVSGMSYDGTASPGNVENMYGGGSGTFTVSGGNTVGSGSDTLVLHICETAYQGDAEFTVSVDGVQVGGILTATTLQSSGQTETFKVLGNWGSGQQTVTVNFVNGLSDAGGSRNLFIWGMRYDGTSYGNNVQNLWGGGAGSFLVGTPAPIGTGSDALIVNLSESPYQGDAEFTVSVDGVQVGGVETATMLASSGSQAFTFLGNWGAGQHDVTVDFVNGLSDAAGSRNLYVQGMSYDGINYASNEENLYGGGTASFTVGSNAIAVSSASLGTTTGLTFISPTAAGQSLAGSPAFGDAFQAASANLNGDTLAYFGGNDVIDLTDMGFGGVSGTYSGTATDGTLTVTNGSHTAAMTLLDGNNYNSGAFTLASDGHSGTLVVFT